MGLSSDRCIHSDHLTHKKAKEDGLPNYSFQKEGVIRVNICSKCHTRIPGHIINIDNGKIKEYFDIRSFNNLFKTPS